MILQQLQYIKRDQLGNCGAARRGPTASGKTGIDVVGPRSRGSAPPGRPIMPTSALPPDVARVHAVIRIVVFTSIDADTPSSSPFQQTPKSVHDNAGIVCTFRWNPRSRCAGNGDHDDRNIQGTHTDRPQAWPFGSTNPVRKSSYSPLEVKRRRVGTHAHDGHERYDNCRGGCHERGPRTAASGVLLRAAIKACRDPPPVNLDSEGHCRGGECRVS
jgi:hypothetical protein